MIQDQQNELRQCIQIIDQFMPITPQKNTLHQQSHTIDSMPTSVRMEEMQGYIGQFVEEQFEKNQMDEQAINFDKFLEQENKQEKQLKQLKQEKQQNRDNNRLVRRGKENTYKYPQKKLYIPKQISPRTVFNYQGIDIQVLYENYKNDRASCLALVYKKMDVEGLRELGLNDYMISSIFQDLESEYILACQDVGEAAVVNSYRLFKQRNYRWLYLIKKPESPNITEYQQYRLKKMVADVLQKCWEYKSSKSIVFADFSWTGFTDDRKCQEFFQAVIHTISSLNYIKRTTINRIAVCCGDIKSYFEFTNALRFISDYYIRCGLIKISTVR